MAKKKQYYDIKNVLSTGAQWIILLGQRANGHSYQFIYRTRYKNLYWKMLLKTIINLSI